MKTNNLRFLMFMVVITIVNRMSIAQNVAITDDDSYTANSSAMLDIKATDKGILIPRLTEVERTAIVSPATGLLIYQTDGASGFYYNSGSPASPVWTQLFSNNSGWALTGNSGTTAGTNFLGTTDSTDLVIKTNGSETIRIKAGGNVGIGTTTPEFRLTLDKGATTPDGGILGIGTLDNGATLSTGGAGTRFVWYPRKAAFRAGYADGNQWNEANIGYYSTAMGYSTTASGNRSTAMGNGTTASDWYSTAMGHTTTASGSSSTAMGNYTTASGSSSTAMGYATTASGHFSTTIGDWATASGNSSTAMGNYTTASGHRSTAIGQYVTAGTAANTIVLGQGVDDINHLVNNTASSLMVGFNSDIPTLFVGPSTGVGTTGSVGIGTTTPEFRLTLDKGTATPDGGILGIGTLDNGATLSTGGAGTRFVWYPRKAAFRAGDVDGTQWDDTNVGLYSTAIGRGTTASGNGSTAMGYYTTALSEASTAMGELTTASGGFSTAIGFSTTASGNFSIATGRGITAQGEYSIAIALNDQTGTVVSQANTMAIMGGNVGIGTAGPNSKLQVEGGDGYFSTIGQGVILRSPDGSCYRVTVANGGGLVTTLIPCP